MTGIGMVTPVGLTTASTRAALGAGISRFVASEGLFDRWGEPAIVSPLPRLASPDQNEVAVIISHAVEEAVASAGDASPVRLHLVLPSPEFPSGRFGADTLGQAVDILRSRFRGSVSVSHVQGAAGGASAMQAALERLVQVRTERQIVVAIDSRLSLAVLEYFERHDRLKDATRPRGLLPGEACACVVLDSQPANVPLACAVTGVGMAIEPGILGSPEPNIAGGATTALRRALSQCGLSPADIDRAYLDLNGEEDKANEWALVNARAFGELEVIHPADSIGDIGVATMPLLMGLAACTIMDGSAGSQHAVVMAGSDDGLRGCVVLSMVRPEG